MKKAIVAITRHCQTRKHYVCVRCIGATEYWYTRLNEHATQYILNSVGGTHVMIKQVHKTSTIAISKEHLHSILWGMAKAFDTVSFNV